MYIVHPVQNFENEAALVTITPTNSLAVKC
jgi:hypothetical protein